MGPNQGAGSPADDSLDVLGILSGTSDPSEPAPDGAQQTSEAEGGMGSQDPAAPQSFKWGGREYKTRQEAEKATNSLYGKYSESQSVLKQVRAALRDPETLSRLVRDPEWAPILAKMGIQEAEDAIREEEAREAEEEGEVTPESLRDQILTDRELLALEREEWHFERRLGRPVTDEERRAVGRIIERASNLTFSEAWKLAFHDKMLKDLHSRHKAEADKAKRPRPSPIPSFVPGVKLDLKKPVQDMTSAEAREAMRNSDEFKKLMSRE